MRWSGGVWNRSGGGASLLIGDGVGTVSLVSE